ncbi:type II secretion system protein GspM [Ketobacter alkanivorans]|uniref:Type II secretion system protein M n=1 Tax=Ketobacter alkanivorans TaxID=1917421 RepID=A0A2K9LFG9_9GAMM|nr:type II secretion system protein M [Ketobacter alkanivorans]AUM10983.1 hypothetical protein Kalk_00345 [Ketobacter alkanivorans]MCP5016522.1 type II secretion system protein M [Ketobacter sp.]
MSTALQNIQNSLDPVRRRYDSMAPSERMIVNGIGVLLVLVLAFLILILPAQRSVSEAEMKLAGQQKLMSWMKENEQTARMAAAGGSGRTKSDQPLQSIVTSTAPALGLTVKRIEPESDDKLRVWLEKVSFDKTVRWLHQIESRYGIQIVNISIDADRTEGLVTAKLVLQK